MKHNVHIILLLGIFSLIGCVKENVNPITVPLTLPSWEKVEKRWARVYSIAAHENQLMVGADSTRLFMSLDQGNSWQIHTLKPGATANEYVSTIVYGSANRVYVGTRAGAFRSDNGGAAWLPISSLPGTRVHSFAHSDSILIAGSDSTIYRSTDDGMSWSAVIDSVLPISLAIDRFGIIYAGLIQRGVFRSTDSGNNWAQVESTQYSIPRLYVDPDGNIWRLTTSHGGYQSTDGGATWNYRISVQVGGGSLVINSRGHLYVAGGPFGVRVSFDGGSTWSFSTDDEISQRTVDNLAIDGSGRVYASTLYEVYRTVPRSQ